ncbi:hypothetical protein DWX88_24290 [Bacteroides xylanisolvens]|nr:hypothetical protein DWX88_24290 [Bacteroides xylanisolvens]
MLKQKYFLTGIFILSAERQPIKLAWRKIVWLHLVQQLEFLLRLLLTIMTMNDEVKYPVIKPEDLPEEEWQELEDIWKRMEANVKASISNGEPLVKLTSYITDWSNLTDGSSDLDEQEDE